MTRRIMDEKPLRLDAGEILWSWHASYGAACDSLEDDLAHGVVSRFEVVAIRDYWPAGRKTCYAVILRDN